ncbi:MAG: DUF4445 domain-containing protein [Verrucomicrobia bacterium]|nr:DUF4445 domain-containing protein [Verrucomicrobiota bacterium]
MPAPWVEIQLLPLGRRLTVARDTPLREVLFPEGVEFPCGGRGKCKGCRVKVLEGELPVTADDQRLLTAEELAAGWRLSCCGRAVGPLRLELAQWETTILSDERPFDFQPREGLGVAVDVGTTTVAAQLLDRRTGEVRGVRLGLNAQARHGADIMSRVDYALTPEGARHLRDLIRDQVGDMIRELAAEAPAPADVRRVVLVGNTVMHHLFAGLDVAPLAHHPFEPAQPGLCQFTPGELGWPLAEETRVYFLPCLGGFVGSDILAGILATGIHRSGKLVALVDLGTNGEMVVGNHDRLLCASTAAGPAFEGARISMGMRAATGAISAVSVEDGQLRCQVLGGGTARGICGSGLVDAVAGALELGLVRPDGRLATGAQSLPLADGVKLSGADIRELQLAKGAIAAGLRLLLRQWGATEADLTRIHLAGAFGNYINRQSARRIGLLPFGPERVAPAGNTALLGAKLALFAGEDGDLGYRDVLSRTKHVSLNDDPWFHESYVQEMGFPVGG